MEFWDHRMNRIWELGKVEIMYMQYSCVKFYKNELKYCNTLKILQTPLTNNLYWISLLLFPLTCLTGENNYYFLEYAVYST